MGTGFGLYSLVVHGGGETVRSPREEFPLVRSFPLQPAASDVTSLAVCDDNSGEFCDECETVIS